MQTAAYAFDKLVEVASSSDLRVRSTRSAIAPTDYRTLHVFLVEDDQADAYLINQALAANPRVKKVTVAEDGQKAMELVTAGSFRPDLMFVDLHMPRKDGFTLLSELVSMKVAWFPSIVLTSSRLTLDERRSRKWGAVGFITKPISQAKLRERLNREIAKL